jgi:hypothetical protein
VIARRRCAACLLVWASSFGLACSSGSGGSTGGCVNPGSGGGPPDAGARPLPSFCLADGGVASPSDAGSTAPVDAGPSACPATWEAVASQACQSQGLTCWYGEGQAQCGADGSWQQLELASGCTELPPPVDGGCCFPCLSCTYVRPYSLDGGEDSYCCNGATFAWETQGAFCPNGNVCGTVTASDYDQSCVTDSDCEPVYQGSLCDPGCGCANAVINACAVDQYLSDLESRSDGSGSQCTCPDVGVACVKGVCTL